MSIDYVPDYTAQPGTALTGKVAIVTGGASGIGDAVGRIFAANQAKVLLVDIDTDRLKKVVASISETGATVVGVTADVCDEAAVAAVFQQAVDTWGSVDLVVNSAGRDSLSPPVTEVTLEEWNQTIGPNLTAVFLVCREAFRVMEKQSTGGRIMNMGSSSTKLASGPGSQPVPGVQARHARLQQEHPARGQGQEDRRHGDQPVARRHPDDRDHRQGPV